MYLHVKSVQSAFQQSVRFTLRVRSRKREKRTKKMKFFSLIMLCWHDRFFPFLNIISRVMKKTNLQTFRLLSFIIYE